MKIAAVRSARVRTPLTRPYAIAGGAWDAAEFVTIEIETEDGLVWFWIGDHGQYDRMIR